MVKNIYIDLKVGLSFAISTAILLILGLYVLLSIQPLIERSKIVALETSDAIGTGSRLLSIVNEADMHFHNYILQFDASSYDNFTKSIHKLNAVLEHAQILGKNTTTLKILHKNLPQLIKRHNEYKEIGLKTHEAVTIFEQNIPKLAFLLNSILHEMKLFLKTLEDFVRTSGGKDAEAFKLIVEINPFIETALLARGDFWRGVSTSNSNAFEVCLKTLKGSIHHMELIKEKNTVKDFSPPLESFIFSMKNLENVFITTITIYDSIQKQLQSHEVIIQEMLNLINELSEVNINKVGTDARDTFDKLTLMRNIVLILVAIGIIFSNTIGFMLARKTSCNDTIKNDEQSL